MHDSFDRVQTAMGLDQPTRRRRVAHRAPDDTPPEFVEGLKVARASLAQRDAELRSLQDEHAAREAQMAQELQKAEASRPTPAPEDADFEAHLRVVKDTAAHDEAMGKLQHAMTQQRAVLEARTKEAHAAVKKAEAEVATWVLRIKHALYLKRAAEMWEAATECKHAAWSVRSRLGRIDTPELINRAAFIEKLPRVPPLFIAGFEDSPDLQRCRDAYKRGEDIFEVGGIDAELRG